MKTPPTISEEEIFQAALQLSGRDRTAYLETMCAGKLTLLARVERLLASHETSGFMDATPSEERTTELESQFARLKPEEAGDRIGPYKLLQQLGEGGFGVVWMAEQDEPVRRRVALKIIKLGMDTKEVIARFEQERQALALMDHLNIARVLDAGATQHGRPFFVMELVRGIRITDFCDQNRLSPEQRLELFIQVCNAVQHAHQKGIIHRDLKPSNILVTLHDGVPVPKVIDFGVAKATERRLTERTLFTQFEQMVGTPLYMSPEQAEMSGLDIDTRTDIYALGVVLYELLAGRTPFDAAELLRAGHDEMRRVIREEDPPKPSTALSTMARPAATSVAQHRGRHTPELIHAIRGDLDWIVMKCLEKDRMRRYETANALATDLRHFLANEPVSAVAPSVGYKFAKFLRRNRAPVSAAAAIAVLLIAGTAVSTWQAVRATRAERKASQEAAIAHAVDDFLQSDVLRQADSREQASRQADATPNLTVREALDRAAARIGERFRGQELTEAAIRLAIGDAYEGVGESARAIPHLERSLALREQRLPANHEDIIASTLRLGVAFKTAGQPAKAAPLLERAYAGARATLGPGADITIESANHVADIYRASGETSKAVALLEQTLAVTREKRGPDDAETIGSINNLASAYEEAGQLDKAQPLAEQAFAKAKEKLGANHPDTLNSMVSLAGIYRSAGQLEKAISLYERSLPKMQERRGAGHPDTLTLANNLASAYRAARQIEKALPLYESTLAQRREKLGPAHPHTQFTALGLAVTYQLADRVADSVPLLRAIVSALQQQGGGEIVTQASQQNLLGTALLKAGEVADAEELLHGWLASRERSEPDLWTTFQMRSLLGDALLAQKQLAQAAPLLEQGFIGLKARADVIPAEEAPRIREAGERLLKLAHARGDQAAIDKWQRELDALPK